MFHARCCALRTHAARRYTLLEVQARRYVNLANPVRYVHMDPSRSYVHTVLITDTCVHVSFKETRYVQTTAANGLVRLRALS